MHRRMAVGCALALVSAGLACGSFEAASTPDANDAAVDSASPAADAAPEDGGATFCARNASAVFCDDFEQPGRDLSVPAPWDDVTTKGAQVPALGMGNASAHALNVKGFLSSADETKLAKIYDVQGKNLRFAIEMKIDELTKAGDGGSNPHLGVAALVFPNGRELVLFLNGLSTGKISGFVRNALTTNVVNVDFVSPPVPPEIGGGWFRLVVELEPVSSGADRFRIFLGPGSAPVLTVSADLPPGESAFVVGTRGSGVDCNVDLSIDNVLVTTF